MDVKKENTNVRSQQFRIKKILHQKSSCLPGNLPVESLETGPGEAEILVALGKDESAIQSIKKEVYLPWTRSSGVHMGCSKM